ncbi:TlpA family protein disulfide reductase [Mucilaginibacter sp. OK283]|uniref:TlpA family protein disulfide reductase n=1 Tax=Mucilaginibacter sp. OK283 TaxID=1881049 RepID=UPI0008AC9DE5|nr:TlpA family protein disulfide reductase [Mucilaginibacter sp. OK283]SEO14556.1 Thiol-disulfide isomerase or thioredoxin [Mucilaginibacter sp. OK283]
MQKTLLIIVLAALCLNFKAKSQTSDKPITSLAIGDTIPEAVWHISLQNIYQTGNKKTITLNDYRGKVIILDFWATWCGTCIARFPHVDSLNKVYQDQVQFILVNTSSRDSNEQKVRAFTIRWIASHQEISVPIIFQKKVFNSYFPCHVLPHYVWIGADGRIKAITEWTLLNKQNIESLIAGLPLNLPVKVW